MKTLAIFVEIVVRLALFAALLTLIVAQAREPRKLARARVRSGR